MLSVSRGTFVDSNYKPSTPVIHMPNGVTHSLNSLIGRAELIRQIQGAVLDSPAPRIVVLTGPAGIGKTALLEELVPLFERHGSVTVDRYFQIADAEEHYSVLRSGVGFGVKGIAIFDDIEPFDVKAERFLRRGASLKEIHAVIGISREVPRPFKLHRIAVPKLNVRESIALLTLHSNAATAPVLSEAELVGLVEDAEGHPLTLIMIASLLKDYTVEQIRYRLRLGLRDLGLELPAKEDEIIKVVAPKIIVANELMLEKLKRRPQDLHQISSRKFEELIAELLDDMGWEVELTPESKDGGKDIIAVLNTEIGKMLCLVEAKHYNPKRPVQVGLVRQLYGTFVDHGANSAMLVTSSRFTRGAKDFQSKHEYQITLKEYDDVVSWIQKYKTKELVDSSQSKSYIPLR